MTLDDLECHNRGFYDFLKNFWLPHTFQERIASKSLKIDQDSLHVETFHIKRSLH